MPSQSEGSLQREAFELTRALRAHVEWLEMTGATGVPLAEREAARPAVSLESPPSASPSGRGASAAGLPGEQSTRERQAASSPVASSPAAVPPRAEVTAPEGGVPAESGVPTAAALVASGEPGLPTPRRLEILAEGVAACTRCELHATRTQTVFARGTGSSGICFVGEAPGAEEDASGFPFVGPAGQLLDKMIAAMGLGRDEVYVCNVLKCRPPKNRAPTPAELAACKPWIAEQLEVLRPQVIVALGGSAMRGLFDVQEGITKLRGKWRLYRGEIPTMPTFHPSYLLRDPAAKRPVWEDLQDVLRHLGREAPRRR